MTTDSKSGDTYDLFMGALDVTNNALDTLRDTPVMKHIVSLMDDQAAGRKFGVAVYEGDSETPHDYYTIRLHNKQLQLVSRGKDAPDIDWKVSTDYLRDVNANPEEYAKEPWKLDVEWLKDRLQQAA